MELIKLENYEFFNLKGNLYMLYKEYILRDKSILLWVDLKKVILVIIDKYSKICKEIFLNNEINNYINLSDDLKKMFNDNYEYIKNLKKD